MEKIERVSRKKSIDVKNLPVAPDIPVESNTPVTPSRKVLLSNVKPENDPFSSLYGFKDREAAFLKSLSESIKAFNGENSLSTDVSTAEMSNESNKKSCEDECRNYISPLMCRTRDSITALLATKDSLDQLDNLHRIVKQLLTVQEQNYQIRMRLRTVKTLQALKSMEIQVSFLIFHFSYLRARSLAGYIQEFHLAAGDYLKSTLISAKQKSGAQFSFIVNILKSF